jgi:hypothetical protein
MSQGAEDRECLSPATKQAFQGSSHSKLNVAEASRPNRTAKENAHQEHGTVGRPQINKYDEAVLTNWTSPLLWIHIEKVASYCHPEMRPSTIVKELQKLDPVLFKRL